MFTVRGVPGKSVRIERSRDLVNWEEAATVPLPASGQTLIDPAATTEVFLFYRAVFRAVTQRARVGGMGGGVGGF